MDVKGPMKYMHHFLIFKMAFAVFNTSFGSSGRRLVLLQADYEVTMDLQIFVNYGEDMGSDSRPVPKRLAGDRGFRECGAVGLPWHKIDIFGH